MLYSKNVPSPAFIKCLLPHLQVLWNNKRKLALALDFNGDKINTLAKFGERLHGKKNFDAEKLKMKITEDFHTRGIQQSVLNNIFRIHGIT